VAHELAHLVLEQFVPHITPNNTVARGGTRNTQIERVVDRVASEILMPERLVVAAISEASIRSKSDLGRVGKHRVIADVRHKLGVSESAMAFRLVELPQLSSVIIRVMLDDAPEFLQRRRVITQLSDKATLESQSNVDSIVEEARQLVASGVAHRPATFHTLMKSPVGFREVACDGKLRTIPSRDGRYLEYWIIGWTSNSTEGSEYDDARIIDGNNSTS
jgi:Zn-dependent peptidase ImmA (M78 family)